MAEAKISISLADGTFEFEGSETFVSTQIERFAEAIQANLRVPQQQMKMRAPGGGAPPQEGDVSPPATPPKLDEIFAPTETGVQILKDVPGNSVAEKTVNAAKLYLYGLNELKQKDTALFEEIAAVCKTHGFHDSANMASNLKAERGTFIPGGSGKKQTLKLTVPGMKAAAKLVDELKLKSGSGE
jgi:hypothetical protein